MAFPKVVVVTGASAGAGRAAVRLFAEKGANVALIARGTMVLKAPVAKSNRTDVALWCCPSMSLTPMQ